MIISYNWLKEYLDIDVDPQELKDILTYAGIEVEAVDNIGKNLDQIKVGLIKDKIKHPNADKLSICHVDTGQETVQVICGAPNCATDQKIAFAGIGTKLQDMKIKKVKLRGVESFGMICSEKELGISENHDGILELPEDAPVGENLSSYLKLKDTCYDVEITPNRPDLLGMIGVARDLAAIRNKKIILPKIELSTSKDKIQNFLTLENFAPKKCTRYTARLIKNVTIKDSPIWLQKRLLAVGLHPINNVVDVTNFVMLEFGHPLHAFDLANIQDKKIVVRMAKENEKFPALDDETYSLTTEDLVIADAERPIALAGIIGGKNSLITKETKDIVIEAANFLYSNIRKTGNRLKISTDSSYRFERDIADDTADIVSRRAAQLILKTAGGELLEGKLDSYPAPQTPKKVKLRQSRIKKVLTIDLSQRQIAAYLEGLGLKLISQKDDEQIFQIPSFRKDLTREIDLIEEIIRLFGYNNVDTHLRSQKIMDRKRFYLRRKLKRIMVENGFSEIRNWSFGDPADLQKMEIQAEDERWKLAKLKNPLGDSFSVMRSTLIPDLLKNARFNFNHGQKDIKTFELNKAYTRDKEQKLATEKFHLSALLSGNSRPIYWKETNQKIDFYEVKGIVEEIISLFPLQDLKYLQSTENYFQQGQAATIQWQKKKIGELGKIDRKIAGKFDLEQDVFILDLDLEKLFSALKTEVHNFQPIPKYPPVLRDLSFIISKKYEFLKIKKEIASVNKTIKKIVLFDEYQGENIDLDKRSLSFSITFSSDTKTLTDEYINKIIKLIIDRLRSKFDIEMR